MDVARMCRLCGPHVYRRWEYGQSYPSYWHIAELAKVFNKTPTELFDYDPTVKKEIHHDSNHETL